MSNMPKDTMSAHIQSLIIYDDKEAKGSANDAYEQTLPDGITLDIVKQVQDHQKHFVIAAAGAAGRVVIEAMAKDPKLAKGSVEFAMGRDKVTAQTMREKEFTNHFAKDGQEATIRVPAYTSVKIESHAGKTGADFKKMQADLSALMREKVK